MCVRLRLSVSFFIMAIGVAEQATAGNVLFVNFNGSDNGIPTALAVDGHSITQANVDPATANTYFQNVNLGQYCAVVWSAAYAYNKDEAGSVATLSNWVSSGGHLLITTPDGIRNDGTLAILLGGSGGTDQGTNLSTVANVANSMTTGLFDIRGQQPPNVSDMDALCSPLSSGTVGVVTAQNTQCSTNHQDPGYAWSLRALGTGQVGFITSGNFTSSTTNDPSWAVTTIPGYGVYNAGLRNFVHSACTPIPTSVPTNSSSSLVVEAVMLLLAGVFWLRRRIS